MVVKGFYSLITIVMKCYLILVMLKIVYKRQSSLLKKTIAETAKRTTTTAAMESATAQQAAKMNPMVLASEALTGLGSLFMVADVISTEVVNGMLNDMSAYGKDLIHVNKHRGLRAIENLFRGTMADELSDYILESEISQEAHNKVLNGEIQTIEELQDYRSNGGIDDNSYTYLIFITDRDTESEKFHIDAIYLQ